LVPALAAGGHQVVRLLRPGSPTNPSEEVRRWDPDAGTIEELGPVDAAINLSGAGIGDRRWTERYKVTLSNSRIRPARLLTQTLAAATPRPKIYLSQSAVGYYGDRGNDFITEDTPPGYDFLAGICTEWEEAARPAAEAGMRLVWMRTASVVGAGGGILKPMLLPYRLGLGGRMGKGTQFWSWIALADWVGAVVHLLESDQQGAVNLASPNPVTQLAFARELGKALRRPTRLPTPMPVVKWMRGSELVNALVSTSQRVLPPRLLASGYSFRYPELASALAVAVASGRTAG